MDGSTQPHFQKSIQTSKKLNFSTCSLCDHDVTKLPQRDVCSSKIIFRFFNALYIALDIFSCVIIKMYKIYHASSLSIALARSYPKISIAKVRTGSIIVSRSCPVGIWSQNDVVSTSMRRHHVASTFIRRHCYVMRPLGEGQSNQKLTKLILDII